MPPASRGDLVLRAPHGATSVPLPLHHGHTTWVNLGQACPAGGRTAGPQGGHLEKAVLPAQQLSPGPWQRATLEEAAQGLVVHCASTWPPGAGRSHEQGFPKGCCLPGCVPGEEAAGGTVLEPWDSWAWHSGRAAAGARELTAPPAGPPWWTLKAGGRREILPGRKAYDLGRKQCALEASRSPPGPETDFLLTVRAVGLQEVGCPLRLAKRQGRACVSLCPETRGTPAGLQPAHWGTGSRCRPVWGSLGTAAYLG